MKRNIKALQKQTSYTNKLQSKKIRPRSNYKISNEQMAIKKVSQPFTRSYPYPEGGKFRRASLIIDHRSCHYSLIVDITLCTYIYGQSKKAMSQKLKEPHKVASKKNVGVEKKKESKGVHDLIKFMCYRKF